MPALGTKIVQTLRSHQSGLLADRMTRLVYSQGAADDYSRPTETYTAATTQLACLFIYEQPGEGVGETEVPLRSAHARFPADTVLEPADRLRLDSLNGEALASPETYEIVGDIQATYLAIIVKLELVTEED